MKPLFHRGFSFQIRPKPFRINDLLFFFKISYQIFSVARFSADDSRLDVNYKTRCLCSFPSACLVGGIKDDLHKVFSRYGVVTKISLDEVWVFQDQ